MRTSGNSILSEAYKAAVEGRPHPWDLELPTHDAEIFGIPYPCSVCKAQLKHRVFVGGEEDVYCPNNPYHGAKRFNANKNTKTEDLDCCLLM